MQRSGGRESDRRRGANRDSAPTMAVALLSSERPAFLTGNSWEPGIRSAILVQTMAAEISGSVRERKHATWREWTTRWMNHYPIRRAKWLVGSGQSGNGQRAGRAVGGGSGQRQSGLPRTNVVRSQWRAGGLPPRRPSFSSPAREHVVGKAAKGVHQRDLGVPAPLRRPGSIGRALEWVPWLPPEMAAGPSPDPSFEAARGSA